MIHCGTLDDVCSYEKMRRPTHEESTPHSPTRVKICHKKSVSFGVSSGPESPTSAKLGSKKSMSFRWITRLSSGTPGNSKRINTQDVKGSISTSLPSATLPPKKPKEPTKRIGFVDILLGYHSLLQASPSYSLAAQRRELHPTIGFIHSPNFGTQR